MKFTKLIITLIFFAKFQTIYSQVTIKIRCNNGAFKEVVYKSYEECDCKSWGIDYYENGNKSGKEFNKSRERIIEVADYWCQRWSKSDGKTYTHSEAWCDDGKYCNTINLTVSDDYKGKFIDLIKNWTIDLADAYQKYKGYNGAIGQPILTQVSTEYLGTIQSSIENLKAVKIFLDNYSNAKTSEIKEQFKKFEDQHNSFKTSSANYQSQLQIPTTTNSTWKILPDGTSYRILPDGKYEFFDGYDQIEILSAIDGKKALSKHQIPSNSKK